MQIGTRGRPHLNPGPTFNLSHIRTTNRHQNQIQLIALPQDTKTQRYHIYPTTRILLGTGSQLGTPLLKFPISTPFGIPVVPVPNRPCFVGAHYWTVIHREPTLPGGQPGPHRNKQTDNSTPKGRSFNVMKSKRTGVTTIKVTIASICPGLGRILRDLFNSLVFAGERALWRKK